MARSMLVLAFLSVASAFAPVARHAAVRASTSVAMAPVEIAQSLDVVSQLPTELVSLEVTTAAFLAVLLGTFFPTFFLVTLYIQSEAYNAANPDEDF